jgi:DNA-binding FrmR family transcriptional regulator
MSEPTVACACGAQHQGGPHAVAVDPEIKRSVLTRLRRIEGQVSSVHEALRGVGRAMLHNHLRHCATEAIGSGDRDRAEAMYDELMDLIYRSVR